MSAEYLIEERNYDSNLWCSCHRAQAQDTTEKRKKVTSCCWFFFLESKNNLKKQKEIDAQSIVKGDRDSANYEAH